MLIFEFTTTFFIYPLFLYTFLIKRIILLKQKLLILLSLLFILLYNRKYVNFL